LWWSKEALIVLQQFPSFVTVWGYPDSIYHPLLFVAPYLDLVGLPINLAWNSMATYNAHLLLSFTLSAFTAYLLGYALTGNRFAGYVAGIIFAFTAHRWAHAFTGHLPHITIYWGPLFAWAMWRFVQSPDKKRGLWVGLTASFVALTHVMHAAYWLLPVFFVFLIWGWQNFAKTNPAWLKNIIRGGLWGMAPMLLLVGPFYGFFFVTLTQTGGDLEAGGLVGNASDLLAYITPPPDNPLITGLNLIPGSLKQILPPTDMDENIVYVGLVGIFLAIVGIVKRRPRKDIYPWLWLVVVSAVLALGPFLKIGGELFTIEIKGVSSYIIMPYALLAELPLLSWGRTVGRLNQTLMLGVAMLSAYGVLYLLSIADRTYLIKILLVGLAGIFVLESMVVFPFTPATHSVSPYYVQAQAEALPASGRVLDLPLRNKLEVNRAMFSQTYHRRPIVGGYIHRRFKGMEREQHFVDLLLQPATDVGAFKAPTVEERLAGLRALNITTIILHKDMVDREIDEIQVDFINNLLPPPIYDDELISVYNVPPGNALDHPLVFARASNWTADGLFPESNSPRHVYLFTPRPIQANWALNVRPTQGPTVLVLEGNDLPVQRVLVTQPQQIRTFPMSLDAGIYQFNWVNGEVCGGDEGCYPLAFEQAELNQVVADKDPVVVWEDNNIQLIDYTISVDQNTGQTLLNLFWLPGEPLATEPTVFVHLLDAAGNKIAQADHRILDGQYPPSVWLPGVLIQYSVPLPISPLSSDDLQVAALRIGLYDTNNGDRFKISSPQTEDHSVVLPLDDANE